MAAMPPPPPAPRALGVPPAQPNPSAGSSGPQHWWAGHLESRRTICASPGTCHLAPLVTLHLWLSFLLSDAPPAPTLGGNRAPPGQVPAEGDSLLLRAPAQGDSPGWPRAPGPAQHPSVSADPATDPLKVGCLLVVPLRGHPPQALRTSWAEVTSFGRGRQSFTADPPGTTPGGAPVKVGSREGQKEKDLLVLGRVGGTQQGCSFPENWEHGGHDGRWWGGSLGPGWRCVPPMGGVRETPPQGSFQEGEPPMHSGVGLGEEGPTFSHKGRGHGGGMAVTVQPGVLRPQSPSSWA